MVTVTNVTPPPPPAPVVDEEGNRLFAPEGSAEGCASGECLPEAPEPADDEPAPPARVAQGLSQQERWRAALEKVKQVSPRHGASLAFGRLIDLRPNEVVIGYTREAAFHKATISAATGRATIEKVLSEHFGAPIRLVIQEATEATASAPISPAEEERIQRETHQKSTDVKVRSHPAVRAVLKAIGGEVEHIQVLEKERAPVPEVDAPDEGA